MACNKSYYLGWMIALKKLFVPEDSPLRDIGQLNVPFLPSPNQSEDEAEETEKDDDEEDELTISGFDYTCVFLCIAFAFVRLGHRVCHMPFPNDLPKACLVKSCP